MAVPERVHNAITAANHVATLVLQLRSYCSSKRSSAGALPDAVVGDVPNVSLCTCTIGVAYYTTSPIYYYMYAKIRSLRSWTHVCASLSVCVFTERFSKLEKKIEGVCLLLGKNNEAQCPQCSVLSASVVSNSVVAPGHAPEGVLLPYRGGHRRRTH